PAGLYGDHISPDNMLGVVRAPEINRDGLTWFNVPEPLSLQDLEGRVVILDFWTLCCINCIHVAETLRLVEKAFPEEVVVIGVHSPKFDAEKDDDRLRQAILRYGIKHPVIHDPDRVLWEQYAVKAWPTLVFLSPQGTVIGMHSGEPELNEMLRAVNEVLDKFKMEGLIEPMALDTERERPGYSRLLHPAKIKPLYLDGERYWALADSGHSQIVLLNDDGEEVERYGNGRRGFEDGPAERARFRRPQGLIGGDGVIYVADTGNHAIRAIDLNTDTVRTIAGIGKRGAPLEGGQTPGLQTPLASPWDLTIADDQLYFANAGTHQLGVIDLSDGMVRRLVGTGGENLRDGTPAEALLAQPSGLAITEDEDMLLFVDAETSALRSVELAHDEQVGTLVGKGLFSYGHENGRFNDALMQHPLAVADGGDRNLYIADSYNDAIRVVDVIAGEVYDLDDPNHPDGAFDCADATCIALSEPAGLWCDGENRLLVVDTNNHRVLEYDLAKRCYRVWAD
ncbi:MAG: thioredoxin-like domain-containing protein, partial [Pseudomonadota bacterium]